ncbi:MAG: hypothetical protein V1861_06905 [Candidatus Micrarchaeota archaeon]
MEIIPSPTLLAPYDLLSSQLCVFDSIRSSLSFAHAASQLCMPLVNNTLQIAIKQIQQTYDAVKNLIQSSLSSILENIQWFFRQLNVIIRKAYIRFFAVDEDQLDNNLVGASPQYASMRRSAWKAYKDKNTEDYARQACISMRELYNDCIGKNPTYRDSIKKKLRGREQTLVDYICDLNKEVADDLSTQCHTRGVGEVIDIELVFYQAQFVLFALFNPNYLDSRFAAHASAS